MNWDGYGNFVTLYTLVPTTMGQEETAASLKTTEFLYSMPQLQWTWPTIDNQVEMTELRHYRTRSVQDYCYRGRDDKTEDDGLRWCMAHLEPQQALEETRIKYFNIE